MSAMEQTPDEEPERKHLGNSALQQGSDIPLGWKPTPQEPVPVIRCVQIKKDGHRCGRWSLRGTQKCYKHNGNGGFANVNKRAEAIIESARMRIFEETDLAVDVIYDLMQPGSSEGIRLKAAESVLDRSGIRGGIDIKVDMEVTNNPAETIQERLAALQEGAKHVEQMREKAKRAAAEEHGDATDIVDAEVIEPTDPNEDGQEVLF
jgi:hypothetical protein